MTKNTTLTIGVIVLSVFLVVAPTVARQAPIKPVYGGEDIVFCSQIYHDNYLIITQKRDDPNSPEFQFKLQYIVHSNGKYKSVYVKKLGEGSEAHIVSGPLIQENKDRTNNMKISQHTDLFVWIEGQASYAYLFHTTKSGSYKLFDNIEEFGGRGSYTCQDIDGDGVFEIIDYDTTWHILCDKTEKWTVQMEGHPFAKLIYRFNGSKYVLSDIVPDYEAEKKDKKE